MCFKCVPEKFAELVEQEHIRPAPYVGRYKWVMLNRLDALRDDELPELIQPSFEMVAAKAPKNSRSRKRGRSRVGFAARKVDPRCGANAQPGCCRGNRRSVTSSNCLAIQCALTFDFRY
jgi:hypothetical protein